MGRWAWTLLNQIPMMKTFATNQFLNSSSDHFQLMDEFSPTFIPPISFIRNQHNHKHQGNMDIYP